MGRKASENGTSHFDCRDATMTLRDGEWAIEVHTHVGEGRLVNSEASRWKVAHHLSYGLHVLTYANGAHAEIVFHGAEAVINPICFSNCCQCDHWTGMLLYSMCSMDDVFGIMLTFWEYHRMTSVKEEVTFFQLSINM